MSNSIKCHGHTLDNITDDLYYESGASYAIWYLGQTNKGKCEGHGRLVAMVANDASQSVQTTSGMIENLNGYFQAVSAPVKNKLQTSKQLDTTQWLNNTVVNNGVFHAGEFIKGLTTLRNKKPYGFKDRMFYKEAEHM